MGCTSSESLLENPIILRNLIPQHKQKLAQAIERNDPIAMALTMQEIQAYPNSEISDSKMGWMMMHLCCRWDSEACLQFLLRLDFVENPKGYINFVNCQTAQGYTCLHLCSIWNSVKCFKVLHKFGGLELNLKDSKLKTPYQEAIEYKSTEIAKILLEYTKLKAEFIYINVQNLLENPLIPPKQSENSRKKKQVMPLDLSAYEKLTDCEMFTEDDNELFAKKAEVEKQLGDLLQKKLQKELGYDLKRALICIYSEIEQLEKQEFEKRQRQKIELELKKYEKQTEKQVESKQQSLKILNKEIRKREKERLDKIKNQSQHKAEQSLMKLNLELDRKLKQMKQNLQGYKQSVMTSSRIRESRRLKNGGSCDMKKLDQIPKQIAELYRQAKSQGFFTDKEFPADNSSIGDATKTKYTLFTEDTIWLRPMEIFKEEFKLFDGIDPLDIKQGSLGVCYMLATVSALATNPQNILKIFVFHDIDIGFYVLRLFVNGVPKFFVVDDLIPCCKTTKSPLFTQPIGKEIWVLLLEKAWAKLIGSYLRAESMTPDHMMQDLSGAPAYGWWLTKQNAKTPTQKIKQIVKHSSLGHIVVVTSVSDRRIDGIVNNHAYSVLEVIEFNNRYVFKIRNPWGRFQWNGEFGEKSSLCTEEFKRKVNYEEKDDGVFYISENQLLKAFCFYSISHVKPDYHCSFTKFTSKKQDNLYFRFRLPKRGDLNLRITQPFDRMLNDPYYKYSPMIFELGKIISKHQVAFISEGHQRTYFGAKSVHAFQDIFHTLEEGEYFIRIRMLWGYEEKYNTAVLACYANTLVSLQRIQEREGLELLKSLYFSFAQKSNRSRVANGFYRISTMKGQFLFIAETEEQGQFKVNFKFNKQKMIKTETEINRVSPVQLQTVISKAHYGVCTARRVEPAQGGTTGSVSITITKI